MSDLWTNLSMNWLPAFTEDFSLRAAMTLLHFLWQGVVVGGVVCLLNRNLQASSAASRYLLHAVALLMLPLCVVMTFAVVEIPRHWTPLTMEDASVSASNLSGEIATAATHNAGRPTDPTAVKPLLDLADSIPKEVNQGTVDKGASGLEAAASNETQRQDAASTRLLLVSLAPVLVSLYFVGVGLLLLRLGVAMWGGHRLCAASSAIREPMLLKLVVDQARKVGLRAVPSVRYCNRVSAPVVVSVLRPVILLPGSLATGLAPEHFAAIISHELAHIRRCDLLVNLVQRIIESLLFFHPVVWLISRRMSAERENCSDDLVVVSGYDPLDYAGALLRMAELCSAALPANAHALSASGDRPSQLESRIWRLIHMNQESPIRMTRAGSIMIAVLTLAIVGMPAIVRRLAQADEPAKAPTIEVIKHKPVIGDTQASQAKLNTNNDNMQTPFRLPDHWIVQDVRFVDNDRQLVTVSVQGGVDVRRWDVAGRKLISEIKLAADKHGRTYRQDTLQLSADGSRVLAATDDYVGIWDAKTGNLLKQISIPEKEWAYDCVRCLDCSADGALIVAGLGTAYDRTTLRYDGYGIVWDADSGEVLNTSTHHHGFYFGDIALSADRKHYATCNEHGRGVCIWETDSGKLLRDLSKGIESWKSPNPELINNNLINTISFTPDNQTLAVGGTYGVKLFNVATGETIRTIDAPYRYYSGQTGLVFSSDGKRFARTGASGTEKGYGLIICSTETGEVEFVLESSGNTGAFSQDGQVFVAAESDFYEAISVWPLVGPKKKSLAKSASYARVDRVEENTHLRGRKAQEFVDKWKPVWGRPQDGIEYGVALTVPNNQFHVGERVLMAAFVRNSSSQPQHVALSPDMLGNAPRITDANGAAIKPETRPLLGKPSHYRDTLQPGESFGPLYFNVGLGKNPRPDQQHWEPFWKSPSRGVCKLAHKIAFHVAPLSVDRNSRLDSEGWIASELTSGEIEFAVSE